MEHILMICSAYERERDRLKDELQSLGIKEFSLSSILNDGLNAGKQIRAIMRFHKNCGIMNRI